MTTSDTINTVGMSGILIHSYAHVFTNRLRVMTLFFLPFLSVTCVVMVRSYFIFPISVDRTLSIHTATTKVVLLVVCLVYEWIG